MGYEIRTQCTTLLYKKSLRLNSSSEKKTSVGKVVNIVSNDLSRIDRTVKLLALATQFPIFFAFTIYQVHQRMGLAVLATVIGVIAFFLLMIWQAVKIGQIRTKIAPSTDNRCKGTEELVGAMNIVKMYCWESSFLEKIIKNRKREISFIKKRNYLAHIFHRIVGSSGKILAAVTFAAYFSQTTVEHFKSSNLFVVQTFIEDLNWQLGILFWTVFTISEGMVSINRLKEVLLLDERTMKSLKAPKEESDDSDGNKSINLTDVCANWPSDIHQWQSKVSSTEKLNKITPDVELAPNEHFFSGLNLRVPQNSFLGIIGPVGSGKTSFLSIFLQEMELSGKYIWPKKIAYCPQESWIFISSVRENILVGRDFNEKRYKEVTQACCLISDFQQFADKDQTIVGERGVTLSGGQRARINLARAIYGDADLYLLDDPLAAVDTKVALSIFKNVMMGYLKEKTRILVTHHVDLLEESDQVLCFDQSAEIVFNGHYADLQTSSNSFLQNLMKNKTTQSTENRKHQTTKGSESDYQTEKGIDIDEEKKNTGKLGFNFFINYFLLCGSNALVAVWVLFLFITQSLQVLTDLQMAVLGNAGDKQVEECKNGNLEICNTTVLDDDIIMTQYYFYIGVFLLWIVVQVITVIQYVTIVMKTSQNVHDISLGSVVKTSMDFFHANPTGRIMNRFTKDMGVLDDVLVGDTDETIYCIMQLLGIFMVNIVTIWFSIVAVVPLIAFVLYVRQYYVKTSREVRRLEGVQQSPVFSHFSESINGRVPINAFQIEDYMTKKTFTKQNDHGSPFIIFVQLNRWLQLRLDVITAIFFLVLR